MRAKDVMTTQVVTVTPETTLHDVAALLLRHHISDVPVVDPDGRMLGIVGEADLIHRIAVQDGRSRSWWRGLMAGPEEDAAEFLKVHGMRAADIMSRDAVTISEDTAVEEIARLFEEPRIRRAPVVDHGRLVGVVSRADLLRTLVAAPPQAPEHVPVSIDDRALRERIHEALARMDWVDARHFNVVVSDGVAHLWGVVGSETEREALRVAVEEVPGVKRCQDHLAHLSVFKL